MIPINSLKFFSICVKINISHKNRRCFLIEHGNRHLLPKPVEMHLPTSLSDMRPSGCHYCIYIINAQREDVFLKSEIDLHRHSFAHSASHSFIIFHPFSLSFYPIVSQYPESTIMKFSNVIAIALSLGCRVLAAPAAPTPTPVAGFKALPANVPSEDVADVKALAEGVPAEDVAGVKALAADVHSEDVPTVLEARSLPVSAPNTAVIEGAVSGLKNSVSGELSTISKFRHVSDQECR
jgi:hypothetical protein